MLKQAFADLHGTSPGFVEWAHHFLFHPPEFDESGIPLLITEMKKSDYFEAGKFASILARFGPMAAPAIPSLMDILTTKPTWIFYPEILPDYPAQEAIKALAAIGESALPPLIEASRNSSVFIRIVAVWALAELGKNHDQAVAVLQKRLADDNPWVRAQTCYALGECGRKTNEIVTALSEACEDSDLFVRAEAVRALHKLNGDGQYDYAPIIEELCERLSSSDDVMQNKAAHVLSHLGKEAKSAVPLLLAMLENTETPVIEAIAALTEIIAEVPSIIPDLVHIVATRSDHLSQQIVRVLFGIGPKAKNVVPHLISKIKTDWPDKSLVIMALIHLAPDSPDLFPILKEIIFSDAKGSSIYNKYERRTAISALRNLTAIPRSSIVWILVRCAHDPDLEIRSAAAFALGKIAMS